MINAYTLQGDTRQAIAPSGAQSALTLNNADNSATIYVAENPGLNGFPLLPGMTIGWDSGRPLWAWADVGTAPILYALDNAGQIVNPKAIADLILAGGLASAIASAISLQGVPVVDKPVILYDSGITAAFNFSAGPIDVSKYASVYVLLQTEVGVQNNTGFVVTARLTTSAGGYIFGSYEGIVVSKIPGFIVGGPNGPILITRETVLLRLPVVGDTLDVRAGVLFGTASPTNNDVRVVVLGSLKTLPKPSISTTARTGWGVSALGTVYPQNPQTGGVVPLIADYWRTFTWNVPTKAAGTQYIETPPGYGGRVGYAIDIGGVTAASLIFIDDEVVGSTMVQILPVVGGTQRFVGEFISPQGSRWRMILSSALAATSITITCNYLDI
jgi:hypothetical protein